MTSMDGGNAGNAGAVSSASKLQGSGLSLTLTLFTLKSVSSRQRLMVFLLP